jgi:hypothetical protein
VLSQDAIKAKKTAQNELKKYENRKLVINKLREKYIGNCLTKRGEEERIGASKGRPGKGQATETG